MCTSVQLECLPLYHHVCVWCPPRLEEDIGSPDIGVKDSCEVHSCICVSVCVYVCVHAHMLLPLGIKPLEEQSGLLAAAILLSRILA